MSTGIITATVGGAIGFMIGGPLGASIGAGVGLGIGTIAKPFGADQSGIGAPQAQEFSVSTSVEGIPIADVLGTSKIAGNLLWHGLHRTVEIKQETEAGKGGGGSQTQTTGYEYYMTWAMGLCRGPVDKLLAVYKNDDCVWEGELKRPASGGTDSITLDGMGTMHFYFGTDDQSAPSKMTNNLSDSTLSPAYRHLCYAFFDDCLMGEYNRMPTMKFVIQKTPTFASLPDENRVVSIYDYNPAHALYYIFNTILQLPSEFLDEEKFVNFAARCADEHLGVSILFDKQISALSYLENILGHVYGVIRYGANGKFQPVLIRSTESTSNMLLLTEDEITSTPILERKTWLPTINEVKVQFNRILPATEIEYDTASWTSTSEVSQKRQYLTYCGDITSGIAAGGHIKSGSYLCDRVTDEVERWNGASWATTTSTGLGFDRASGVGNTEKAVIVNGAGATSSDPPCGTSNPGVYHICATREWNGVSWSWDGGTYPSTGTYESAMTGSVNSGLHVGGLTHPSGCNQEMDSIDCTNAVHKYNGSSFATTSSLSYNISRTGLAGNFFSALQASGFTAWGNQTWNVSTWDGTAWATTQDVMKRREGHRAVGESNTSVLVWGGVSDMSSVSNETFYFDGSSWSQLQDAVYRTRGHGGGGNASAAIGVAGTNNDLAIIPSVQIYNVNITSTGDVVNFKKSEVIARDQANQWLRGAVRHHTVQMSLFTNKDNAMWVADRNLKQEGYPLGSLKFSANRNAFRLEPGDPFLFSYSQYNLADRVFRVTRITEEGPESEQINIEATEDINYLSNEAQSDTAYSEPVERDVSIQKLDNVKVFEIPYVQSGEEKIKLGVAAGRETLNEIGFGAYRSLDNTTYDMAETVKTFSIHGTLNGSYPSDTYTIDDTVGFEVTFDNSDVDQIENISRANMISGNDNVALIGDEIISFQYITPVSGSTYKIEKVFRGRFDTTPQDHSSGAHFYLLSTHRYGELQHAQFLPGTTRYVKAVPFNGVLSSNLSDATAQALQIEGRALKPYMPTNLKVNGVGIRPTYDGTGDLTLTWAPRHRTEGAGQGAADYMTAASPTWEGNFMVKVYHWELLKRTVEGINNDEWTYTSAMNSADGGPGTKITFQLSNYRTVGGTRYESDSQEIVVRNTSPSVTTTTTTV